MDLLHPGGAAWASLLVALLADAAWGEPQWLYVANLNSVVRFPYRSGDLTARAPAETVLAKLSDGAGGHKGWRVLPSFYTSDDAAEKFVRDFVKAWTKVTELDRFDLHR